MEFGTQYEAIEDAVATLEAGLGIVMRESNHAESGTYFHWASDLGAKNGVQYYGMRVKPALYFDPEENERYLGHTSWEGYTFVISVSDELTHEIAKIRELIAHGVLKADEIPTSPRP